MKPKIIIIPGNGDSKIETDHWYAWACDEFKKLGFEVIAENMPDPVMAHKNIWLPHIKNVFKVDEHTIVVGHSSGGVAALRYLENEKLLGAIVIGVNHTDLGYEEEKESGYYSDPWQWEKIKKNAKWIVQFSSTDDPYISIDEPRFIHHQIGSELHEFTNRGHFGSPDKEMKTFPELIEVVQTKLETV